MKLRFSLIGCVFYLNFFSLKAQVDTNDYDFVFYNKTQMLQHIFGQLSYELSPTGLLLDRNTTLDSTWLKYKLSGNGLKTVTVSQDWFDLFHLLEVAQVEPNILPSSIDTCFYPYFIRSMSSEIEDVGTPILMLDFAVNKFDENALLNGNLVYENGHFSEGLNPTEGILTENLYFVGLFTDTLLNNQILVEWDNAYILSNRNASIDSFKVQTHAQSWLLSEGQSVTINNLVPGENYITFTTYFSDSTVIQSRSMVYVLNANKDINNITTDEVDFFDFVASLDISPLGDPIPSNPHMTYAIKYACGNDHIRKPVFFIAGFGMASTSHVITNYKQTDCVQLYFKYNIEGLIDNLRATGHDIIIVRFVPAVSDVMLNGQLLESLITTINQQKANNGSDFENVLIGYSAGALIAKYTLDMMEFKHLEFGSPHPHSKLSVSYEGEHQGANVPIGSQIALDWMHENSPSIVINTLHYMANSIQAKQLLMNFHTFTGQMGTSYDAGQGNDPARAFFIASTNNPDFFGHDKQVEKYGYYGYPAFCRNVAVVNGSRITDGVDGENVLNSPYLFQPNHTVFEQENNQRYWLVKFNHNMRLQNQMVPNTVFQYQEYNIYDGVVLNEQYRTDDELLLFDNAPGGFLFGDEDMQKRCFDKMAGGGLSGDPDIYEIRATCFTPTISCLDIRNFSWDLNTFQVVYDLQENGLMFQSLDVAGNPVVSDFYGYPVLGHPTNHFTLTPFEAIYSDEWNETHIDSRNAVFTGTYPGGGDLQVNGWVHIKNFIMREVEPDLVYLQNRQVGWNTDGSDYTAQYEASIAVFLGELVTPKTDIAPYEILSNGNISCQAGEFISITNGFHAKPGSSFHAYIAPVSYVNCAPPDNPSTKVLYTSSESQKSEDETGYNTFNISETEENTDFIVFPNPTTGAITLTWSQPLGETGNLCVYDLSGKLCFTASVENALQINLSLQQGLYITALNIAGTTYQVKLIIQ